MLPAERLARAPRRRAAAAAAAALPAPLPPFPAAAARALAGPRAGRAALSGLSPA
ncbi:MAG TPA: acetyl-CoA carboxylase biotin carboxyl carrier protein subunit, partial [Halieaceae bacterium]|nr:acetyl-CoA carboxylase biotin carboxyl carrier protein subunit [Halieaceae bacterium]